MGIGHVAVGLGLKKAQPEMNVGWLIFAALLADFLLGVFALLGLEQAHVPADYATRHYLTFTFPYSHGLVASLVWAVLAAAAIGAVVAAGPARRRRLALIIALAVISHFVLDGLVHVPELPLAGQDSYKFGLGLWDHPAVAVALEVVMTVAALVIYLKATRPRAAGGTWAMPVFVGLLALLMFMGQWRGTTLPTPRALAISWVMAPVLIAFLASLLDRLRAAPDAVTPAPGGPTS